MPTVSSTASVSNTIWQQVRAQQAQREAAQADQAARALQAQANDARATADRAIEDARSLEVKASQARTKANETNMNLRAFESMTQTQVELAGRYSGLPETIAQTRTSASAPSTTAAAATTTTTGTTSTASLGTVVNTTA